MGIVFIEAANPVNDYRMFHKPWSINLLLLFPKAVFPELFLGHEFSNGVLTPNCINAMKQIVFATNKVNSVTNKG